MMNAKKTTPFTFTKLAGSNLFANNPKTRKPTETLEASLSNIQESIPRAITNSQPKNVSRSADTRRDYKANPTPRAQAGPSPKATPASGAFIDDNSFQESNISGGAVVKNFSGFDIKSARVIKTAAFKGATITGGSVSNFCGTR